MDKNDRIQVDTLYLADFFLFKLFARPNLNSLRISNK